MRRTIEVSAEIDAMKVEMQKNDSQLQLWVTDVRDWAASSTFITGSILIKNFRVFGIFIHLHCCKK